jgi:hypothetical protein
MRPLVRNALWLAFATMCGIAGLLLGYFRGIETGADVLGTMARDNAVSEAFGEVSMSLEELEVQPGKYSDARLRTALFVLGTQLDLMDDGWTCRARDASLIPRAAAYLKAHPKPDPQTAQIERALAFCRGRTQPS